MYNDPLEQIPYYHLPSSREVPLELNTQIVIRVGTIYVHL